MSGSRRTGRIAAISACVGLLWMLSACSAFVPKLQSPTLSLVSLKMMSGDIFSQKFRVRIKVENPNDRELPIKSIEYELFMQGDSFAKGNSAAPFVVPSRGEMEFDLTMETNFISSFGRLFSKFDGTGNTQVQYDLLGAIRLDKSFVGKVPFSQTGVIDLRSLR
jgi:LEA14-like dessication related protein